MTSAYTEKKSSGVDWLGEIPRHWNISALKRVLSEPLKYGATEAGDCDDRSFPRYLRITDFDNDGSLRTDTFASLPEEIARDYYVNEGDVLFARSGATVGKTFLFRNYQGRACFAGYLIKASPARHKLTPEFLYYFTKSPAYEAWRDFIFTQATIQNIGADKYAYLPVCLPPLPEQQRIAAYLDASCAAIDAAVAAKRRQLETLDALRRSNIHRVVTRGLDDSVELKKSAVEWLGRIPAHWAIKRIKDIVELKSGDAITSDSITPIGEYPVFGGNGLRGYTTSFTHSGYYALIGRQGALCGNINYASGQFWASEHAVVATTHRKHDTFWFGELLRVMNLNQYSNAAAQPGLAVDRIKFLRIPIPPYEEQIRISSWLKNTIIKNEEMVSIQNQLRTTGVSP
jgi:type I restriction enzyme S subunit